MAFTSFAGPAPRPARGREAEHDRGHPDFVDAVRQLVGIVEKSGQLAGELASFAAGE
jgi:hypothetical protein